MPEPIGLTHTTAQLVIALITRPALERPEDGRDLFRIVGEVAPVLMPGRAGRDEPPRRRFSWDRLEREWGDMLYAWTSGEVDGVEGLVFRDVRPPPAQLPSISINAPVEVLDRLDVPALVRALAERFDAWFGYAHVMTDRDRGTYPGSDPGSSPGDPPDLILTEERVRRALPPPTWLTVLGPELLARVGADAIAGAPAAVAELLDSGLGVLQLTTDPVDCVVAFEQVDAARRAVQEHLGPLVFRAPTAPGTGSDRAGTAADQVGTMLAAAFSLAADLAGAGEIPATFGCLLRADGRTGTVSVGDDVPALERDDAMLAFLRTAAAAPDVRAAGVVSVDEREARVTLEHREGERMEVRREYHRADGTVRWEEPRAAEADLRLFV